LHNDPYFYSCDQKALTKMVLWKSDSTVHNINTILISQIALGRSYNSWVSVSSSPSDWKYHTFMCKLTSWDKKCPVN
jgi:hypothetical protein